MSAFGTSDVSQQGGTAVSPTQDAVADNSGLIQGVGQLGKGILAFNQKSNEIDANTQRQLLVSDFANQIDTIHSSIAMKGGLTKTGGNLALNRVYTDALRAGLAPADVNLVKGGFGDLDAIEDPETILENELVKLGTDRGAINVNMTRAEQIAAGSNEQKAVASELDLAKNQKELTFASGKNAFEQKKVKQKITKNLQDIAGTKLVKAQGKLKGMLQQISTSGNSAASKAAALGQIEVYQGEIAASMVEFAGADQSTVEAFMGSINFQVQLAKDFANDKFSSEAYAARSKNILAIEEVRALQSPNIKKLATISRLVKTMSLTGFIEDSTVTYMQSNADNGVDKPKDLYQSDPDEKSDVDNYLKATLDIGNKITKLGSTVSPEDMETHRSDYFEQNNAILRSVGKHGIDADNPAEWSGIVNYFNSPEYIDAVEKLGVQNLDPDAKRGATLAFKQYGSMVMNAVAGNIDGARVGGKKLLDVATPTITPHDKGGVTVVFKPKEGVQFDRRQLEEIRKIQVRTGRAIGNFTSAMAHVNGTRDYKAVFEDNFRGLFGVKSEAK